MTQPIQLKDFLNYRFLSEVRYAPDGRRAAFVVSACEEEQNGYSSRLYLYEDGQVRQMTDMGKERGFFWLDAYHILFPAVRSEQEKKRAAAKEQFTSYYALDVRGGEALPAFTLPFAAAGVKVLDETHLAVLGALNVNVPDYDQMTPEARAQVAKNLEEDKDYEVFDEIPFWFNGEGVTNKQRVALYLVETEPLSVRRVTGDTASVNCMAVLGDEVFFDMTDWTDRMPDAGCCIQAVNWLTGESRTVYQHDHLSVSSLLAAGDKLYVAATEGTRYGLNENAWVYTLAPQTGELTVLRQEEYSMYSSVGSDCRLGGGQQQAMRGNELYYVTTREGDAPLFRLHPDGSDEQVIGVAGSVDCFDVSEQSNVVLMVGMFEQKLQELYAYDLKKCRLTQVTHFNDAALKGKYVAKPKPLSVESEGYTIGGWVLEPKDYDPSKRYPAVLDIHGGPKTVYGTVFYHEMQLWASMGYFVFFCNPKGSDGRDNEFADIRGHYGETDYRNLMDFTDAVLAAYPQIDPARVCETGGSYGGFMTNWIIGHTNRFCCAASQRSIANWLSFYGVSDIGYIFATDQNAAHPFENPEQLWAHSPLKYAGNAVTPTLFIHSDEDYRCPLAEGLQMFTALKDKGIPARICVFHGENHELSRSGKPLHRIRRLEEITNWFEHYSH
ncbi:MAG: alpha/beta hydrolase family protein [Aristaeellaceae bacterium]